MSQVESDEIRVTMSSSERRGAWKVPRHLRVRVMWGNAELDLRDAILEPGTTTIEVEVAMGNVELLVPPGMPVELGARAIAGNVEHARVAGVEPDPSRPGIRVIGRVKLGNCEIVDAYPGETTEDATRRERYERHAARHARFHMRHHRRLHALRAEREMWQRERDPGQRWQPWWLMARMRRRTFSWMALAVIAGILIGYYAWDHPRWWHIVLGVIGLSMVSGAFAWRLTQPLLLVVRAARDIGDGKLDTRIDVSHHRGEIAVLGTALNDMAGKIQQQIADQRQLLAAVSHELRTPLGHMRVLIETARDQGDTKALAELEKEVLVLDDLVGRLLAQSRLEFGNLDRHPVDLGELVADVVTAAGLSPETIEATGEVTAAIDPTLIRRAVANLVHNARVHGGGAVAVRIERRGGQVAIEVDDAGPGVPADRRADAFRAFVPSSGGGLGLGLALVSRIAVAHGGGAWIADRPGGGARVGFTVGVHA
ncbi:MAG TPA: ATP-binding protein [Kofleriaceae bacterium]|nr:ATP-binding protein [Kofleriaceae bacterium]